MTEIRETSRWFVCGMAFCLLARVCAAVEFAGGTGEPNDPYQIATAEQLIGISSDPNLLSRHFILVNDIDLDPNLPGGRVFAGPVIAMIPEQSGIVDPNFTGTLDGRGFRVCNLAIHARPDSTLALGLFGRIGTGARVRNLAVENALIRGNVANTAVGALVGTNWGYVEACYATGSVVGVAKIGGLCGENRGEIRSCYAAASVSGQQYVGGLVGYGGPVLSRAIRGSVAGAGRIINCYASGAVSGHENVGGLAGTGGTAQACFWDIQTTGQGSNAGWGGLPTFQMMDAVVFATSGWDRDSNWVMDDGRDYPRLVWEGTDAQPIRKTASDCFEGTGTPRDPYHIATAEQFALLGLLSDLWDKHFVLDADLDLAGIPLRPFSFNGFFHGNRHVLRHLTMEIDGHVDQVYGFRGLLFGTIGPAGRVSRMGLEDVSITVNAGSHGIGVLAAVNEGVVTGCYVTGVVQAGQSQSTVGLVGHNKGMLARSYAWLDITGSNWTGALVGLNYVPSTYSGLVLECYAALGMAGANANGSLTGTNAGLVLNSYFLSEPEEPPGSGAFMGTPLIDSQMRQAGSFIGWDFAGSSADGSVDRWHMADDDYPILSWQVNWQERCPIPDIANLPLDWAKTELEMAGFTVGEILYDYHSTIPTERAILPSPVGLAPIGSVVNIIASQGGSIWSNAPSFSYYGPAPSFVELETPGQVESLAGRISGETIILLTRDIDMAGWDILPKQTQSSTTSFSGVFIGQGHKVSHLKTYRDAVFFDQIGADGFVHGLRLEDVQMLGSGDASVGRLAAVNNGIVMQCAVTGVLLGSEGTLNLGGFVGKNMGIIEGCFADAVVHGSQSEPSDPKVGPRTVGGMVGYSKGKLTDSYSRGSVSGAGYAGGLVGSNDGTIDSSYSAASVVGQAQDMIGGLVGRTNLTPPMSRRAVLAMASVLFITDCCFLSLDDGGGLDNGLGTSLTDSQMRQQASFVGWDFEDTWTICEGVDYPRLRWEVVNCEVGP